MTKFSINQKNTTLLTFNSILIFLILLTILVSFFPWIKLSGSIHTDLQPYALLCASILFYFKTIFVLSRPQRQLYNIDAAILFMILGSLITIIFIFSSNITYLSYRASMTYITIIIFSYTLLNSPVLLSKKTFLKISEFALIIWISVGLIQYFYDRTFLTFLLNRTVITQDRGVISLSCEPGYFGAVLSVLFFIFILERKFFYALLSVTSVMFLAKSSVAVGAIFASIVIYCFFLMYKNGFGSGFLKTIMIMFVATLLVSLIINSFNLDPNSRITRFIIWIKSGDLGKFIDDGSLNIRLSHISYSIQSFIKSFPIPHDPNSWVYNIESFTSYSNIFWNPGTHETNRINSGLGTILYEGGIGGLMILIGSFLYLSKYSLSKLEAFAFILIFAFLILVLYSYKQPFVYVLLYYLRLRKQEVCCAF